jgi:hypothetical protein
VEVSVAGQQVVRLVLPCHAAHSFRVVPVVVLMVGVAWLAGEQSGAAPHVVVVSVAGQQVVRLVPLFHAAHSFHVVPVLVLPVEAALRVHYAHRIFRVDQLALHRAPAANAACGEILAA